MCVCVCSCIHMVVCMKIGQAAYREYGLLPRYSLKCAANRGIFVETRYHATYTHDHMLEMSQR